MLVVISDLHFTDGETSNWKGKQDLFNVDPKAFELFFAKIAHAVRRRKDKIKKVTFVYNGDIFDPLRTNKWFNTPRGNRPWALPLKPTEVYDNCHKILEDTVEHNDEALQWLSGTHKDFDKKVWNVDAEIERVYIPGNHDRIINLHKSSRALVRRCLLGKARPSGDPRFKNFYMDKGHRSLVMHGHESDLFNCELGRGGHPDYAAVPIGDVMTTMLFAKIGYEAAKLNIRKEAKDRFRDIDNVRPHLAAVRYVQDIIRDFDISKKVNGMIEEIIGEFKDLPFYEAWIKKHDRLLKFSDEADKLKAALRLIETIGTSVPAGLLKWLSGFLESKHVETWASSQLETILDTDTRYCILGHTHEPVHVPLYISGHGKDKIDKHYLNCGTFRTTFAPTFDKQDFLRFQRMSYVVIYAPYEYDANLGTPMYELWSGLRMNH